MRQMERIISNIFESIKQLSIPIFVLVIVFLVNAYVQYKREKEKDEYMDELLFWKTNVIIQGMACSLALLYECVFYFLNRYESDAFAIIVIILFYVFLIMIVQKQNEDNNGYILDLKGASGAITYITASLSPIIFGVLYAIFLVIIYIQYKKNERAGEWRAKLIKRIVDLVGTIVAIIIVKNLPQESFLLNLWGNCVMISIFTLLVPLVNQKLYEKIDSKYM